jgi:hypothetical protein
MAKSSAQSTYAMLIGEIAIGWNRLEREINNIALHYLREEPTVATFVLAKLRNEDRADFLKLLVNLREEGNNSKYYVLYLVSAFKVITSNRNVLAHGIPATDYGERYVGHVYKLNNSGKVNLFEAPIHILREQVAITKSVIKFARALRTYLRTMSENNPRDPMMADGVPLVDIWIRQFGPPPLPRVIDPLELG